ncbi:iron compound ABC transporter, periplasmic substrate-binding protein [Parvularcula bermudensis HTCC2503]|uniref:Iron compound ABC transporter, periplasmic substrate-binding protein n=1 Tax=Parvularcula bermudensis (strain ATCC BAA-594 / HTCC2503 / KCTC 12087) TaxID=314260 RepID=E0TCH2_PARBH|nr:iron compound ABC transporter, periplasmic substrate-binding protein [Parvularcula bermudensis HTCC2503]
MQLADRSDILAVSPQAGKSYSAEREKAHGLQQIRPSAEELIALKPALIVRSYGGGPPLLSRLEAAGLDVVTIPWTTQLSGTETASVLEGMNALASALGADGRASRIASRGLDRHASAPQSETQAEGRRLLYLTAGGVVAGPGTLVDDVITRAGYRNYQTRPGWQAVPLERLVLEKPDLIVVPRFGPADDRPGRWSAARHPHVQALLDHVPTYDVDGSLFTCGGEHTFRAIETLASLDQQGERQ